MSAEHSSSAKTAKDAFELEKRDIVVDVDRNDVTATPSSVDLFDKDSEDKEVELDKNGKPIVKPEPKISYLQLYRFAAPFDYFCVLYVFYARLVLLLFYERLKKNIYSMPAKQHLCILY